MTCVVDLPGFRFHPTEEELLDFYLKNMVSKKKPNFDVIGVCNIYRHDPRELPGLAKIVGEREWYFFVPRDRKHGGGRPNRTTETGFWKATGSDRKIVKSSDHKRLIGLRKTLVFYLGRAPHGNKTDWVMNEYRFPDNSPLSEDMVLCKIYRKATSMKVLEQRAAMEEATKTLQGSSSSSSSPSSSLLLLSPSSPIETVSFSSPNINEELIEPMNDELLMKKEVEESIMIEETINESRVEFKNPINNTYLRLPSGNDEMPQLQLPRFIPDWTQDSFWTQFNSPWHQSLTASPSIMNF